MMRNLLINLHLTFLALVFIYIQYIYKKICLYINFECLKFTHISAKPCKVFIFYLSALSKLNPIELLKPILLPSAIKPYLVLLNIQILPVRVTKKGLCDYAEFYISKHS